MQRIFLLILALITAPFLLNGQSVYQSNFNIYNGLPSDHVYYILKDSYGYLWMATTQGVVRYNGYSFKVYDRSDGLPNSDVWDLFEDNKKRMWLSSLSTDIGYIQNGKYKKIYIDDTDARMLPTYITNTASGIMFCNLCRKDDLNCQFCVEKNDTLYSFFLPGFKNGTYSINRQKQAFATQYSSANIYSVKPGPAGAIVNKVCTNIADMYVHVDLCNYLYEHFYITYTKPVLSNPDFYNEYISVYDLNTCQHDSIKFKKGGRERITLMEQNEDELDIFTDKNIYRYDLQLKPLPVIPSTFLVKDQVAARNVLAWLRDPFWGRCVGTATNGVYIDQGRQNSIAPATFPTSANTYAGESQDAQNFWWNKEEHKLTSIDGSGRPVTHVFPQASSVKIFPYSNERSLLLSNTYAYWYHNSTGKIDPLFSDSIVGVSDNMFWKQLHIKDAFINAVGAIHTDKDVFLIFANNILKFTFTGNNVRITNVDAYKYKHLSYDSTHHLLWAYNEDKILIYNTLTAKKIFISRKLLDLLHIAKVEQLFFDNKNNNVFLKDYDHFFVFNTHTLQRKELFTNYNLVNSTFALSGDLIIAAGKFGVLFSKIEGPCTVSKTMLYRNVKSELYQRISDVAISAQQVILNTDKGPYSVFVPPAITIGNTAEPPYRLILNYQDTQFAINNGDTVNIKQFATSLSLDVINPLGSGTPKYSYRFGAADAEAHILSANELTLPKVTPGHFYTLYLNVYDDVWKSRTILLHIYVLPYWWQSSFGRKVIFSSALVLLAFIIALAIYITRRVEERKNRKQSLQLGLELKAVYAQLNPHFIFNSLNLTLYLISKNKLDEAYTHVLKFSGLLRAYLKSCRNRFITIADETTNISNYMQLQQMRFDNIFTYQVIIDPQLSQSATRIPALILQPIVENAINHGLLPKGKGGELLIQFALQQNKAITITVDDNGVGREQAGKTNAPELKKADSYGSDLTNELIEIFNKYENAGIELYYTDKVYPLTGTTVTIEIKNPSYNAR